MGRSHNARLLTICLAVILLILIPNSVLAQKYSYELANSTGTVRSPSVNLLTGNQGSSSVSAGYSATVTATAGLTFYENASAPIAAPALDQSVEGQTGALGANSATAPILTTLQTNDLIYVIASIGCELMACSGLPSISDTQSHSWTPRSSSTQANNNIVYTWYTTSAAVFSATVTVTLPGGISRVFTIIAFGVSGVNTASPFDPGVSACSGGAQCNSGSGISPQTASSTITTTNPNDFIIGALVVTESCNGCLTVTKGAAFTLIQQSLLSTELGGSAEYETVSAPQSGLSVSYSILSSASGGTIYWSMVADAVEAGTASASKDTALAAPGTSGSFALNAGSSAFLWSPAYTAGGTIYAGNWLLDLWASKASSPGTLAASIYIVSSANAVTATVLGSGTTGSIPTSKTEVKTTFAGSQAGIPAKGRILVVLTNPKGGTSATIYWGASQLTNFQTPNTYNYVLQISNPGSSSWTISLATMASLVGNLGRLTNLTIWFTTSPVSKQIIVTGGSLTQSSGSGVTLPASTTINIALAAYANAVPTAANTPSTVAFSIKLLSSTSATYAQYIVNLSVN